jgi:hypothetical protein
LAETEGCKEVIHNTKRGGEQQPTVRPRMSQRKKNHRTVSTVVTVDGVSPELTVSLLTVDETFDANLGMGFPKVQQISEPQVLPTEYRSEPAWHGQEARFQPISVQWVRESDNFTGFSVPLRRILEKQGRPIIDARTLKNLTHLQSLGPRRE